MIELLMTLMICGTLVYVARLWRPQPAAKLGEGQPIRRETPPVPNDLLMQASKWRDAWAREQALKNIQEIYEVTQDWDRVRYIYSQQSLTDDMI